MASLVYCDGTLLLCREHLCLFLQSSDDTVYGIQEVLLLHGFLVVSCSDKSRLVAHVGDICTRESRCLACQLVNVKTLVNLDRLQVHHEYRTALIEVRQVNAYLAVETSCAQQRRVEHVNTVGSSQYYHTAVCAETIHLGEQGVKSVLTLVVASHCRILRACSSHSVNLIDEDDARCFLFSLAEEVAHTAGTHTHEHLNEVRARHREERHSRLACNSLGKQCLSRSRRSHEQCALRNLSSQVGIFLRILQELHNLLYLLLCTFLSRNILECHVYLASVLIHFGLALAHREHSRRAGTAAHAPHNQYPNNDKDDEWRKVDEDVQEVVAVLVLVVYLAVELSVGVCRVEKLLHLVHAAVFHLQVRVLAHLVGARLEDLADILALDIHLQLVVALVHLHLLSIAAVNVSLELGVGSLLVHAAADGVAAREIESHKSN